MKETMFITYKSWKIHSSLGPFREVMVGGGEEQVWGPESLRLSGGQGFADLLLDDEFKA